MQKIITEYLDPSCYTVVQGAIPETTALLDQKWDMIFYTGSANVGTIIAKKAAETLTPVTLELGGKNPAIVTKQADIRLTARRLLWGKLHNAGQVCVSQNFSLIDREIVPAIIEEMKKALKEFFPNGIKESPDYARIVNQRQFLRNKKMLDDTKGKIVIGGTMDEADLFIEPTVVLVEDLDDSLIKDESFGPLLPLLPVTDLDEAIRIANEVDATPLGMYAFGSQKEMEKGELEFEHVLQETGRMLINRQFSHKPVPAAQPSTTVSSMPPSPPCPSAASEHQAKALTVAKHPSTFSPTEGP